MKRAESSPVAFPSWCQAEQDTLDIGRRMNMKEKIRWLQDAAQAAARLHKGPVRAVPVVREKAPPRAS